MREAFFVEYRAPSAERRLLGDGWGVRDVRGPYMASAALLSFSGDLLTSERISGLTLCLECSNRLAIDVLNVNVGGDFGQQSFLLARNKSVCVEFFVGADQRNCGGEIRISLGLSLDRIRRHQTDVVALNWVLARSQFETTDAMTRQAPCRHEFARSERPNSISAVEAIIAHRPRYAANHDCATRALRAPPLEQRTIRVQPNNIRWNTAPTGCAILAETDGASKCRTKVGTS